MIHIFQQTQQQLPQTSEPMNKTNQYFYLLLSLNLFCICGKKMLKLQQSDFVVDDTRCKNGLLALMWKNEA